MKEMKEVFTDSKYLSFDLEVESNDDAAIMKVQTWLKRQTGPVLLVLAQRQHQVDSISNDVNSTNKDSLVLITSRRRDLVAPSDLYEMPIMEDNDALELFRWHSQRPGTGTAGVIMPALKVCCETCRITNTLIYDLKGTLFIICVGVPPHWY
jgi:hypothetical protein